MKLTQIARIVRVAGALLCLGLLCAMWRAPEAASHLAKRQRLEQGVVKTGA